MRLADEEGIKRVYVSSLSLLYMVCVDLALWLIVVHDSAVPALVGRLIGFCVAVSDVMMWVAKKLSFYCQT